MYFLPEVRNEMIRFLKFLHTLKIDDNNLKVRNHVCWQNKSLVQEFTDR